MKGRGVDKESVGISRDNYFFKSLFEYCNDHWLWGELMNIMRIIGIWSVVIILGLIEFLKILWKSKKKRYEISFIKFLLKSILKASRPS